MCSIAGLVWKSARSPDETASLIRAMNAALRHRGPDGEGAAVIGAGAMRVRHWNGRGEPLPSATDVASQAQIVLGLGMNRLAIRDVEHGQQPMLDSTSRVVIVFNGEIYNTDEVERDLRAAGVTLRTRSDTEVILEAYALWGRACVHRLAGMFAFAIWDERDQSLFIARDRLGIKPLVWADVGDAILFGSELKSLLATNLVPREVRLEAIERYLYHLYVPAPDGPLKNAHILPPGHWLVYREGRATVERYWAPSFAPGPAKSMDGASASTPVLRLRLAGRPSVTHPAGP